MAVAIKILSNTIGVYAFHYFKLDFSTKVQKKEGISVTTKIPLCSLAWAVDTSRTDFEGD